GYNNDRVSRVYVLLGLDAKVLVDLEDAPQGAARIGSNIRPRPHDTVDLLPLEVRCDLIGPRTEVALPPAVVDRSHDLHVLVRHRLLRQPHGFEGVGLARVHPKPPQLAVAHRPHMPPALLDPSATLLSPCRRNNNRDHVIPGVDPLLDL